MERIEQFSTELDKLEIFFGVNQTESGYLMVRLFVCLWLDLIVEAKTLLN